MHTCWSNYVFAILFGAILIVSMMSGSAEVPIINSSPDHSDSLSGGNFSISTSTELDSSPHSSNQSIDSAMLKLPLSFIENRGQSPEDVRFMVRIEGPTVFFTPSEVVFSLSQGNNSSAVHMAFENSNPGQIIGEEQLPGQANFFIGNDSTQWISDIPTFGSIRYKEIYPGVDLIFKGREGYLKHELDLDPGADLSGIILTYSGQDNLSLAEDGSLLIRTSAGNLTDSVPICYQEINGSREMVEGRYRLVGDNGVGFEIVDYDRKYPLVIDPTLAYSTYLGGSGDDSGLSLALDSSGNAYVTGYTASTNFPTKNPLQASNAASSDVFIAKINSAGSALSYSTYLGGGGYDYAKGIAVDSGGNAYVTGYTASTNFPTKNPLQASNAGSNDAFIAKINSAGSALSYSTYLGGSGEDNGESIAIDGSGNAYVTGYTGSASFPTRNPIQASKAGSWDAFVTKINSAGSALVYSTYLGGSSSEYGLGIALDGSSNAYITGPTYSTNFPTRNPLQASNGGEMDAFVSKINSAGSALTYSTYLGGSFNDFAEGIAVDRRGNAYITGYTISDDFPTQNPIQALKKGSFDAFVAKINSAGSALDYSTFLGGSGDCFAHGIAVDSRGNAFVTGDTSSADFPAKRPLQASNSGSYDIFVAMINAAGSALSFSTYLGGVNYDYAKGIAIDNFGKTYLTGYTESNNFPTRNPLQPANGGYKDAFVAVIDCSDLPNNPPNTPSVPLGENSGFVEVGYIYFTFASDPDGDQVKYTFDWGDGSTTTTNLVDSGATASMSHSWINAGVYRIKAMATDSKGATSGWSEAATIKIIEGEEWTLYYPDFTDTVYPNSWRSWLMLQNPADEAVTMHLELRDRTGELRYAGSQTIPANSVAAIRPRDLAGLDFAGSAVVTSDRPIAGSCQINRNSNEMCMSYNPLDRASTTLHYPDFTDTDDLESWRSWLVLQNPGPSQANLNLEIRSRSGELLYSGGAIIPAHGVSAIRPRNLAGFNCAGSAVVSSDQPIAGTCQITRNNNLMCMSYTAADQGSTALYYPDFTDTTNPEGWRSWLVLQNPGASQASINLEIRSRAGDLLYSGAQSIPAQSVSAIRPRNLVGSDLAGSAVVTSNQPIVGTCQINRNNNLMCMSFNALLQGSTTLFYPDFTDTANPDSWRSWLLLQNPADYAANAALEIKSREGGLLYSGIQVIPAHGVSAIRPRSLVGADCSGSVVVASDQPLAGVCQINRNNNLMCMSYSAAD